VQLINGRLAGKLMEMNVRSVLRRLVELGGSVFEVSGTGEFRVSHPRMTKPVTIQSPCRRKDATRALLAFLRRIESGKFDREAA
jgi:hypothetical protein